MKIIVFTWCLLALSTTAHGQAKDSKPVHFLRDVAPVLLRRCSGCHGEKRAAGDYRLHSFAALSKAGASGEQPIVPGQPDASELFRRLLDEDEGSRMPQQDDPLTAGEVALIRAWIDAGATFDGKSLTRSLRSQLPPRRHPRAPEQYRVAVPVFALAFDPTAKRLAVGGYHEVTLWNTLDGKLVGRVGSLPQRIQAMIWAPSGELIVAGGTPGEYGEVCIVETTTDATPRVLSTFDDLVLCVALNRAGTSVAAASANAISRLLERASGKRLWQARVHSDWITGVAFSSDGKFVVTCSRDQTAKVHEALTGKLYTTYNGHRSQLGKYPGRFAVFDVQSTAQGASLISAGQGRALRVWNPRQAKRENGTAADMEARFFKAGHTKYFDHGFREPVYALCSVGDRVLAGGGDGIVREFSLQDGKRKQEYRGHTDWVYAITADAQGRLAASASYDGQVRIWDMATGASRQTFLAAPGLSR